MLMQKMRIIKPTHATIRKNESSNEPIETDNSASGGGYAIS
jgi:hypothetical protein